MFLRLGRARRDNPDVFVTIRVDDHQQTACRSQSKSDESLLVRVGLMVRYRDGIGIIKDRDRFLEMAEQSGGKTGYQTLINAALREYLEGKAPRFEETLRRVIREELKSSPA